MVTPGAWATLVVLLVAGSTLQAAEATGRPSDAFKHRQPLVGLTRQPPVLEGFGQQRPPVAPYPQQRRRIPKIFHQVYISGYQHYRGICQNPVAKLQCSARDSCLMYLQDWEQHLWNLSSIQDLISTHYPWALSLFNSYDMEVKKADVGRAFILHRFGGLYLDIDVQCFRDPTDSTTDYDFIIQGSGFEGVNNGMMASAPGLSLWQDVLQVLEDRAAPTGDEWKDGPIFQTGPRVLGEVFSQQLGLGVSNFWRLGFDGGIFHYRDMVLRVMPLGQWFMPCWIWDDTCRSHYERGEDPEITADLSQLVGYHQFASIWG